MTPLHLGGMHPFEQALTLVLAFGPFAVLGVVVALRRRAERRPPGQPDVAASADEPPDQRER